MFARARRRVRSASVWVSLGSGFGLAADWGLDPTHVGRSGARRARPDESPSLMSTPTIRALFGACFLAAASSSCNGPAAAGRDFIDPYRILVGLGSGAGVRVNSLGLVHTGIAFGVKLNQASLGLKYGEAHAFQKPREGHLLAQVDQS